MDVYGRWRTVCAARSQWMPWHAIAYKCLAVKGSVPGTEQSALAGRAGLRDGPPRGSPAGFGRGSGCFGPDVSGVFPERTTHLSPARVGTRRHEPAAQKAQGGSSCHVGLDSGAPGAGPLPGGRVDGRRDDSEHFAWLKYPARSGQARYRPDVGPSHPFGATTASPTA